MKKKEVLGVFAVLGIGALEFLCTFQLYRGVQSGSVLSVRHAAAQPMAFLLQSLRECLLPAVMLILFAVLLKKDFTSALYFRLHGKWQRTVAAILTAVILGFTLYGLVTKQDKASILVNLTSLKNEYRDDAVCFHRRSCILPPADKGRLHVQMIVKAAFIRCPKLCLTVSHIICLGKHVPQSCHKRAKFS